MRASERGFSLIELLVVLVIAAILMAVVLPTLGKTRSRSSAPEINVAAGGVWRGIQNYRIDYGALPPTNVITSQHSASPPGSTLRDPGGGQYIKRWPNAPTGGALRIENAGTPALPTTRNPGRGGRIFYYAAGGARPLTGYLVAYSTDGQIVFRRSIGTTAGAPIG